MMQTPILRPGKATQRSNDFPPYSSLLAGFVCASLCIIDWYVIPGGAGNALMDAHRSGLGAITVQSVFVVIVFFACSSFSPFIERNVMGRPWPIGKKVRKKDDVDHHHLIDEIIPPDRKMSSAWPLLHRLTGAVAIFIIIGICLEWQMKRIVPQTIEVDLLVVFLLMVAWPHILPWFSRIHVRREYASDASLVDFSTDQNRSNTDAGR
jgi:hypothetical protein